jgi:hypothetical protein
MIHVATVHYRSNKWIDIQLAYLRRHLHEPYRVVASLEAVPGQQDVKFDRVVPSLMGHPGKLNLLAAEIVAEADPDDLIMFIDGDAFPIVDPMPTVRKALEETVLIAVRRDENEGDPQPHPCFCVIRVGDWDDIRGDWSMGHCWTMPSGLPTTDAGGNLLATLERRHLPWTPIVRTNTINPHPLWFAVYGDIVYHHGAGFRNPMSRSIKQDQPRRWKRGERVPKLGRVVRKVDDVRIEHWQKQRIAANRILGDQIFTKLAQDPDFYLEFLQPAPS